MPVPQNRPVSEVAVVGHMADLSSASSTAYLVATHRGRLVRAYTIIANATTTGDAAVTVKVRGTTVGTITVTQDESAAGDVDSAADLSPIGTATYVNEGDLITFVSDGGSDTTTITRCTAVIRRS
jgi:hypothetical protein